MGVCVETIQYKGLNALQLENEVLSLVFLPDYACKMASLVKKNSGREFLFQSKQTRLTPPPYGAAFSAYDSSGFDEVLPSMDHFFQKAGIIKDFIETLLPQEENK